MDRQEFPFRKYIDDFFVFRTDKRKVMERTTKFGVHSRAGFSSRLSQSKWLQEATEATIIEIKFD